MPTKQLLIGFFVEKSDVAEQAISRLNAIAAEKGLSITALPWKSKVSAWTDNYNC